MLLYIPFWLYSNAEKGERCPDGADFTFHSGYILIIVYNLEKGE